MPSDAIRPSKAELRRQHTLERREQTATDALGPNSTAVLLRPAQSFAAQTYSQAMPREFIDQGLIAYDQNGRPMIAAYDPSLLAPNPQRGRLEDQGLDELAASLDQHGQQQPIIGRLVTPTDRERWPEAFAPGQIIVILNGHRIYFAQPKTKLSKLRVEIMVPEEGESDLEYIRRGLRRASVKMMHSQSYGIFDKVHLYMIWRQEYAIEEPKDAQVANYFEISRTEAQRVKAVANLEPSVREKLLKLDRRPADEIIYTIANRPVEEQPDAFRRFGSLTVAGLRALQQASKAPQITAGRPRNFFLSIENEDSPIATITTTLTAQQWKNRGGSRAFWAAVKKLMSDAKLRQRLHEDLK